MKLKYIDAIRGIAIVGVIIVHTGIYDLETYHVLFSDFIGSGARGVQLFFMASALTIFLSFNRRNQYERYVNRNFFVRRLFRIAPMYYLGIAYYFWQNGHIENIGIQTIGKVLSQLLFVHGASPYWIDGLVPGGWSITVEMTFYVLVPVMVARIRNTEQAVRFTILSILLADILNYLLLKYPLINNQSLWNLYSFLYFPNQLPLFGLGITAYFIIIKKDIGIKPITFLMMSALFVGQLIWGIVIQPHVLFGVGFLVFMVALSRRGFTLVVNEFTCYLGKVSYSAYLVHFAVIHWLKTINLMNFINVESSLDAMINYWIRFSVVISVTVVISSIFYHLVEKRFISIGNRIISRSENVVD